MWYNTFINIYNKLKSYIVKEFFKTYNILFTLQNQLKHQIEKLIISNKKKTQAYHSASHTADIPEIYADLKIRFLGKS